MNRADGEEKRLAVLVSVYSSRNEAEAEASLRELERLIDTAGGEAAAILTQVRDAPDSRTVIGRGKCGELMELCENSGAELVVFDCELTPSQIKEIEKAIEEKAEVIDRSMLILDIFAAHARSAEGALQVELAQLRYTAPRLTGRGKEMSRLGGSASGSVGARGQGETKLELDRRRIRSRIAALESELERVARSRDVIRKSRERSGICRCAIVGYTNAGKSTLLNRLTEAGILAEDKLFATLDTTTRRYTLPGGQDILLTDTVGFIRNLPHHLIKAFRSTLDEVVYSDILIIIVDASDPECESQLEVTEKLLSELGAADKSRLYVMNKCDAAHSFFGESVYPHVDQPGSYVCAISAKTGEGIDKMIETLEKMLAANKRRVTFRLSQADGGLIAEIYSAGENVEAEYLDSFVEVTATVDERLYGRLSEYIVNEASADG